jgi:hypothetical protein
LSLLQGAGGSGLDFVNVGGTIYQRCSASNLQTDPLDETLIEHACVFRNGYEE